jgi:hypothetical protein
MQEGVPFLAHLEGVREFVIGHAWLPPGGLSELHPPLFWRFMFLISFLLCFEMKVGGVVEYFF